MPVLKGSKRSRVAAIFLLMCSGGLLPAQTITAGPNLTQPERKLDPPELSQAQGGNVAAELRTGEWYNSGVSGRVDSEQAAAWFKRAADRGSPDASALLGSLYLYGHGMEVDQARAYLLIQSSVDRGSFKGRTFLAQMYMHGWYVQKNDLKAHELLMSVGDKDPLALTLLGVMAMDGPNKHPEDAMSLFNKASQQGESGAMLSLGEMYLFGSGVNQDFEQAAAWFKRAWRMDNRAAEFRLGQMYAKGAGVPKNLTQAYSLFHRAAEQGYVPAQTLCGTYNYFGFGIAKDRATAYYWFSKAAKYSSVAKGWMQRASKNMTPEEVSAAAAMRNGSSEKPRTP
jgi:uncharacterized protein